MLAFTAIAQVPFSSHAGGQRFARSSIQTLPQGSFLGACGGQIRHLTVGQNLCVCRRRLRVAFVCSRLARIDLSMSPDDDAAR